MKKKEKMAYVRFLPKVVISCSKEEAEFDYKNNHGCGKLANFWIKIISKINFKTLVVMLYIS